MDIGSIGNLASVAAIRASAADPELAAVARIESAARARGYSSSRKQVVGRQDSDAVEAAEEAPAEPESQENAEGTGGQISFFA
jgi:hypothetical protein